MSPPPPGLRDTCIFVASSDNTFDVLELLAPSILRCWQHTGLACYAGLNERSAPPPLQTVQAPATGWRSELAAQIAALPAHVERVVLVLDDFHFVHPVDAQRLARLVTQARSLDLPYLRLKPVERSAVGRLLQALTARRVAPGIVRLAEHEPYYASLQVSLWQRRHLQEMLALPGTIWAFEHQRIAGREHCAVARPLLDYTHLVEKGRWYRDAPRRLGLPQDTASFLQRGHAPGLRTNSRWYNRLKFLLLGYSIFRLRRWKQTTRQA